MSVVFCSPAVRFILAVFSTSLLVLGSASVRSEDQGVIHTTSPCTLPGPESSTRCTVTVNYLKWLDDSPVICVWLLGRNSLVSCTGHYSSSFDWRFTDLQGDDFELRGHYFFPQNTNSARIAGKYLTKARVVAIAKPSTAPGSFKVTANSANNSFALSWASVSGATRYELFNGASRIHSGSARSYTFSNVTPDKTYTFKVKACNAAGCGNTSDKTAKITTPSAPSNVSLTANLAQNTVTLSWGSATGTVTEYIVRKVGSSTVLARGKYLRSKTFSVSRGASYSYEVSACNGMNCKSASSRTITIPSNPSGSLSNNSPCELSNGADSCQVTFESRKSNVDKACLWAINPTRVVECRGYSPFFTQWAQATTSNESFELRGYIDWPEYTDTGRVSGVLLDTATAYAVEPPPTQIPPVPAYLSVVQSGSSSSFAASWGSAAGATRYEFYVGTSRKYSGMSRSYTYSAGSVWGTFSFKVRACNSAGCSAYRYKNISTDKTISYEYDALGRLKAVAKDGDETNYQYDAAGNREFVD